jgi:ribonuclease HI
MTAIATMTAMAETAEAVTLTDTPTDEIDIDYCVYTDGSCLNNGKATATAGIGIFFGDGDPRNVSMRVTGKQSNNTAELGAIIKAHEIIEKDLKNGKNIAIVSDSEYAIKCATTYGKKCSAENWQKEMPNRDLVKTIYDLYKNYQNVFFVHIMAHTGKNDIHSVGNDGADRLANDAIGLTKCPYSKIFLNVPFAEKDVAKDLGARWDASKKKWYIFDNSENKDILITKFPLK